MRTHAYDIPYKLEVRETIQQLRDASLNLVLACHWWTKGAFCSLYEEGPNNHDALRHTGYISKCTFTKLYEKQRSTTRESQRGHENRVLGPPIYVSCISEHVGTYTGRSER